MDRLCVARPIELGEALPVAEQVRLCTLNELNVWNQGKFAARPEGQKIERSLEQMYNRCGRLLVDRCPRCRTSLLPDSDF